MRSFEALFQPGRIGTLELENRLVMSAMGNPLVDGHGSPTPATIDYYRARACGGIGLITTQAAGVSADATPFYMLAIWEDRFLPGWRELCEAVHAEGGKICIQLMHFGMLITFAGFIQDGMSIKVPTVTPWMRDDRPFQVVSEGDIDRYVEDYAAAAWRAKEAGADAVELHACHGCLLGSFLSPAINRRTDEYGGDIENRARFARRVVESIKHKVGQEFPLLVKIDCDNDIEGGVTVDEAVHHAVILEAAGADAINVSSGVEYWSSLSIPCYIYPDGPIVSLAERVKRSAGVPVVTSGKIGPELAQQLVESGVVDFVALGRPMIADPDLPRKLKEGQPDDIRRCVYCNNCIRTDWDRLGYCAVNPFVGRESDLPLTRTQSPKDVMVVGGGIAGMNAAAIMAERGHNVALFERTSKLGGQWAIASATPGKEDYTAYTDYLKRSLDRLRVPISLGVEVTKELVQQVKPDVVVVATGAVPKGSDIPGANAQHVMQANDVIMGLAEPKGNVVVIGGRFVGMEVAVMLAERGERASVVALAALGENGGKLERMIYRTLVRRLIELRVPVYTQTAALEITPRSVVVGWQHEIFSIPADAVVLAVGAESDKRLVRELEGIVPALYAIGDCVMPSDAPSATHQAAQIALSI